MAVCPYCGCKGTKTPHTRIAEEATAQEFGWRDLRCGSCGRPFRGYPYPSVMLVNYPRLKPGACSGGPLRGTGLQFNRCEG